MSVTRWVGSKVSVRTIKHRRGDKQNKAIQRSKAVAKRRAKKKAAKKHRRKARK